jgi:hypothetical protein
VFSGLLPSNDSFVAIRCSGNVITEPLLTKGRPLLLHYSGFQAVFTEGFSNNCHIPSQKYIYTYIYTYRMPREECAMLRECIYPIYLYAHASSDLCTCVDTIELFSQRDILGKIQKKYYEILIIKHELENQCLELSKVKVKKTIFRRFRGIYCLRSE